MYAGRAVEQGTLAAIFDHPLHPYTKGLLDAVPIPSLKAKKLSEYVKNDLNPMDAAKIGLADDIIEPAETRAAIISALSLFYAKSEKALPFRKHPSKSF